MAEAREAGRSPNRLINETSPYLLQHAHNPVEWFPWGPDALDLAKRLNKPILLSIGYSACHWCHVMERESFEDPRIAALMNESFVCVKVDREERPDLDEIYMHATLALNHGQGGWPMTVFLTPEQEPIFAGTYYPPTDRWGRPGFSTVLTKIAEYWRTDAEGLRRQARDVTERLRKEMHVAAPISVGEAEISQAVAQFAEEFDARYGGFGRAPKFPPATGLSLLLRRYDQTGDEHILTMVRTTLDAMAAGGMYDQVGGGFARYSTDERWLVPHFEKMLYDNALLTRTYLEAYQRTGDLLYRRVATETLEYVLHEMTSPESGFYSATDADSEGVEGKFFVWTPEEIRAAVPTDEDARRFCAYYDITTAGNWEHKSIPNRLHPADDVARELGVSLDELVRTIARLKPLVYEARRTRIAPALDDKIITAWNGMMISAMAEGARILGDNRYLEAGEEAADFLLRTMIRPDHGLYRTYRDGRAHLDACLEDYAFLAEGLLDLYEAGAHEGYLDEAVRLADRIRADFADRDHGGFYTTAESHEALIVRSREGPDGATPSGNAVAAMVLARLSFHYGREDFRSAATGAVRAYGKQIARYPRAFAKTLAVADLLLNGPVELALVGTQGDLAYEGLRAEVSRRYLPNRVIAHYDPQGPEPEHPLTTGKGLVNGAAALYICRQFACQQPITDPRHVASALESHTAPDSSRQQPSALEGSRITGQAHASGTGSFAGRVLAAAPLGSEAGQAFTAFGSTGLTASRLGFGCYRVGTDDPDHRQALINALRNGCNVIDTSTNYMDGDSERLVGSVLADLIRKGDVQREQVIVVSKAGYVQGENLARAQAREKAGKPYPEMVKYAEGLWHCLYPEFLADQLSVSLDRLGLQTLDVLLLHNVEYFLSDAAHRGSADLAQVRAELYGRLQRAFVHLEGEVAAGRIQWYGVSSNTCTAPPDDPEATSLSRMLDAARAAGGQRHHFAVIQLPMNLLESAALLTPNTGPAAGQTVLEHAGQEGLAVLVNRPLNAIPGAGRAMIRLAELPLEAQAVTFDSQRHIVATLEEEYRGQLAPEIQTGGQGMPAAEYFRWADELTRIRPAVQNLEHWEQIESQMIAPHVHQVLRALSQHFTGQLAERWEAWRDRYLPQFLLLLKELRREATIKSREKTRALADRLDPLLPETQRKERLSRKALWILLNTPGVTCVLNGMRTPTYVEASMAVLRWPSFGEVRAAYEAMKTAPF